MNLSLRLKAVEELVDNNSIVIDIGCDHAYLPISLILNNKSIKAYAVDNKIGPLNNALLNINSFNLNDSVKTILSDGFKDINISDYNTVTITGMGAINIINILDNAKSDQLDNKTFIFEANRDSEILRKYLSLNGYQIIDEGIVKEDDIYYFLIKAIKNNKMVKLSDNEINYGPFNLIKKDILLKEYLNKMLSIYEDAFSKAKTKNDSLRLKIKNIKETLYEIE